MIVACVVGAYVTIVAAICRPAGTYAILTGIIQGAEITITAAGSGCGCVDTSCIRVARIGSTGVSVVAANGAATLA